MNKFLLKLTYSFLLKKIVFVSFHDFRLFRKISFIDRFHISLDISSFLLFGLHGLAFPKFLLLTYVL